VLLWQLLEHGVQHLGHLLLLSGWQGIAHYVHAEVHSLCRVLGMSTQKKTIGEHKRSTTLLQ
jgi:hypothetical protein